MTVAPDATRNGYCNHDCLNNKYQIVMHDLNTFTSHRSPIGSRMSIYTPSYTLHASITTLLLLPVFTG